MDDDKIVIGHYVFGSWKWLSKVREFILRCNLKKTGCCCVKSIADKVLSGRIKTLYKAELERISLHNKVISVLGRIALTFLIRLDFEN